MSKERKTLVMTRYFILQKNDHNNLKYMAEKDYVLLPSSLVYTLGSISKEIQRFLTKVRLMGKHIIGRSLGCHSLVLLLS